jgi:2-polyprenyl-3-methyl-5-hydroxy-6-metoxy-1,4-benzoquinol methylase
MLKKVKKYIPNSIKTGIKNVLGMGLAKNSDVIPYIRKYLRDDIVTILDVGCGKIWEGNDKGEDILFSLFNDPRYKITGIDISNECINWRKINGPKGKYLVMDALDIDSLEDDFDLIIIHHVLEHFNKEESKALLGKIEDKAKKQIIVGTPIGFTNTEYGVLLHHNDRERHLCGWYPNEFEIRRFTVKKIKNALLAVKNK